MITFSFLSWTNPKIENKETRTTPVSMSTDEHPLPFEFRRRMYLDIRDSLDKWFDKVFRKYIRQSSPDCEEPIYTLHFGGEEPWYVVHRLKLLLTYVMGNYHTFNEVYNFTHEEILFHLVRCYKIRCKYRDKRRNKNPR